MNVVLFVAVSLLAGLGGSIMALVAGIWILDLTGSVSLAGLAGLCVYAPTLAGPWLGAVVDRLPRRALVITVDLLLAAALLTLLTVGGPGQVWLIFAVMTAYGISYVLLDAGESALLPAVLPAGALGTVNGWRSSAQEGMKLVGPLTGTALYVWQGGSAAVLFAAAMPLAAAGCYALLRLPAVAPSRSATSSLTGGLAALWDDRDIRRPVLIAATAIGMSGFGLASLYSRVTEGLDLPSSFIGVLTAVQGAGSILAGLVIGRVTNRLGPTRAAAAGAVLFGLGAAVWCLPWWPAILTGSALVGIGLPSALVAAVTAIQIGTPSHLLGRVSATANTVLFGPIALTNPLGAAAGQRGGPLARLRCAVTAIGVALAISTRRAIALEARRVATTK